MFLQNRYYAIYTRLIARCKAQNRVLLSKVNKNYIYYERHHIVPRSLGGDNSKNNLVLLTSKEHFLCHRLLVKFTNGIAKRNMAFALMRMSKGSNGNAIAARLYERSKKELLVAISGPNHPNFGKPGSSLGKKFTEEHKSRMSSSQKGKTIRPESRLKQSNAMRGRELSADHKNKISEAVSGYKNGMYGRNHTDLAKKKIRDANSKTWIVVYPSGIEKIVHNLHDFCRTEGLDIRTMQRVACGSRKQHKGFTCRKP